VFAISKIDEAKDLVVGTSFLATGGGGNPDQGFKHMKDALKSNSINVVSVEELPKDTIVAAPYFVGSVSSKEREFRTEIMLQSVKELELIIGKKIGALAASEIGGGNTSIVFYVASKLNLPVVDGDFIGRAAPELEQSTANIFDYSLYPSVISTNDGDIVLVKRYANTKHYEYIARQISIIGENSAFVVDTPITISQASNALVKGSISLSMNIGKLINNSEKYGNVLDEVVKLIDGFKVSKGVIKEINLEEKEGFLVGDVIIEGEIKKRKAVIKDWIKNEHIFLTINNKPAVFPPDLIVFAKNDGHPILNYELKEGMEVNVIASKAPKIWRSEKGLELFGPRHFGFNYDYVPVEELIKEFI
jgi:DUF917 family protein